MSRVAEFAMPAGSASISASAINFSVLIANSLALLSVCHKPAALYHFDDPLSVRLHLLLRLK